VAEGTSLLRMHTAYTCIVSSNLTVSASIRKKAPATGLFFVCLIEISLDFCPDASRHYRYYSRSNERVEGGGTNRTGLQLPI
jgi:hypothetical protein